MGKDNSSYVAPSSSGEQREPEPFFRTPDFKTPVPGPWSLKMETTGAPEFWPYAVIEAGETYEHGWRLSGIVNEADARKLVAAPEMYEALSRLTADIDPRALDKHYHTDWKLAVDAVKKARGETQ